MLACFCIQARHDIYNGLRLDADVSSFDLVYVELISHAKSSWENLCLDLESLPILEYLSLVTDFSYSLAETEKTLEETKNRSAISLLAAEEEINQLKKQ